MEPLQVQSVADILWLAAKGGLVVFLLMLMSALIVNMLFDEDPDE